MFYLPELLTQYAQAYTQRIGVTIESRLGRGIQGMVFLASNHSAIKVHADRAGYARELNAYSRLAQHYVTQVRGFNVPILRSFDDEMLVLEISIVKPPFVLDFGGAYLDQPPPHAGERASQERWMMERREKFGENLGKVNAILAEFEARFGIHLLDVHPGNICFE